MEKMNVIELYIYELVLVPNFSLYWQFWILDEICPKIIFPVVNKN